MPKIPVPTAYVTSGYAYPLLDFVVAMLWVTSQPQVGTQTA